MEELPKTMTEESLTPEQLNGLLPPALRPVDGLRSALYESAYPFATKRLSAFPRFARTQAELMELLDISGEREADYREAFLGLCKDIAAETSCLSAQRRYKPKDTVYTRLSVSNITHDLVVGLAEEDSVDIILPEIKLALIGHDDFGCHALAPNDQSEAFSWLKVRADRVGLYLLDTPSTE